LLLRSLFFKSEYSEAESYYQALRCFRRDPDQDFAAVKRHLGLDVATIYAQLYFQNQKNHQRFRREIELHSGEYNQLNSQIDVLVVAPSQKMLPSHLIKQLSKQASSLATSAGFMYVTQAQLHSNNVLEGARRLQRILRDKSKQGRQVILVSFSFGSAVVRVLLDHLSTSETKMIKGWLNASGLIFGTPRFHCSDKKSFYNSVNIDMRSFSCEQTYFQKPLDTKGIKTVHMLAVKLPKDMMLIEQRNCSFLKAWGPNDGLVPFRDYQNLQAPVIPVMGQNHLIDFASVASLYVRSLSSMVSTLPQQKRFLPEPKIKFVN